MAALSQEKIFAIIKAYDEIGTYSGVAKKLQCSAATVKKYIEKRNEYSLPKNNNIVVFNTPIKGVNELEYNNIKDFINSTNYTEEEFNKIKELWEEI